MNEYADILATVNAALIGINALFLVVIGFFVRDTWNQWKQVLVDVEDLKRKTKTK